jgi:hypothetical protein
MTIYRGFVVEKYAAPWGKGISSDVILGKNLKRKKRVQK